MQLTTHTDYALRTLVMLAVAAPEKLTVGQIGTAYGISGNHLVKVVGRLTALGYVTTSRGKEGGVRLAMAPEDIVVGQVVREVESELGVVGCLRSGDKQCAIAPACKLTAIFQQATEQFLATLSQYRLSDVLSSEQDLARLLQIRVPAHRKATSHRASRTAS